MLSRKGFVLSLALAVSTTAFANPSRNLIPVSESEIDRQMATGWAPLDANGNVRGPIREVQSSLRAASWKVAFDSMNTNPVTQATYSGQYYNGPGFVPAAWRLDGDYRCYMWANDVTQYNSGTERGFAKRIRVGFFWNPNGLTVPDGTLNWAAKVYTANTFDNSGDGPVSTEPITGVMFTRANLPVIVSGQSRPNKEIDLDLSATNGALALGKNGGTIHVEFGTYDTVTGEFQQFSPLVQISPLFSNMFQPAEPTFPGTNPSRSTWWAWEDNTSEAFTSTPNYAYETFLNTSPSFPLSELLAEDFTNNNPSSPYNPNSTPTQQATQSKGYLQPAIGLFQDQNAKTISGTLNFTNLAVPASGPKVVSIQIRNSSTNAVLSTQEVALSATNGFILNDPNPTSGGSYKVSVKESTWLRKVSATISTTANLNTNAGTLSLINGDVDGDGEVGPGDFEAVVSNFGTDLGPEFGDVDRDGEVGPSDFEIVVANFGLGDDI
jgi:hypothetical protein